MDKLPIPGHPADMYNKPFFVEKALEDKGGAKLAEAVLETNFALHIAGIPGNSDNPNDEEKLKNSNITITDCPCGPGHHSEVLRRKGYTVTPIDRADALLEKAQKHYPYLKFKVGTFDELTRQDLVKDGSQDAVFCLGESVGYQPTVEGNAMMLCNMYRKLKPGGKLVIQWPYTPGLVSGSMKAKLEKEPYKDFYGDTMRFFHPDKVVGFERRIPDKYNALEEFRDLELEYSAPLKNSVPDYEASTTQANYLKVQTNKRGEPTDAPIIKALCDKHGIPKPEFKPQPPEKEGDPWMCAMVIQKPTNFEVISEDVRRSIEWWSDKN